MKKINIIITREYLEEKDIPEYNISKLKNVKLNIISLPVISVHPIESDSVKEVMLKVENGFYNHYIFLSSQAVNIFFNKIKSNKNRDLIVKELQQAKIYAIGPKTKSAIIEHGFETSVDISQKNYSIENIISFLKTLDKNTNTNTNTRTSKDTVKVLIPRSSESIKSNNFIKTIFENLLVDQIFFYEIKTYKDIKESVKWDNFINLIHNNETISLIFTSPSNVREFFKIMSSIFPDKSTYKTYKDWIKSLNVHKVISIGPKTSEELQKYSIEYLESEHHTIYGALTFLFNNLNSDS